MMALRAAAVLLVLMSAAAPVSASDPLDLGRSTMRTAPSLWPAARFFAGPSFVIPAEGKAHVGPVGFVWGIEGILNVGHAVEVGLRFQRLTLGSDGSIYQHVNSNEFLITADLPLVNSPSVRWGLGVGLGFGMLEVQQEKYLRDAKGQLIPNQDINGDGIPDTPAPIGHTVRKDTGPIASLSTTVAWFPVDFVGARLSAGVDYRYTPNLDFKEGALLGLVLVGVEGHF